MVSQFQSIIKFINKSLQNSVGQTFWFHSGQALRFHSGQAALIVVFALGILGVFVAVAFSSFGPSRIVAQKAFADSDKAYYAAQSGIEELMVRLRSHHAFGDYWSLTEGLNNSAVYHATISGDLSTKIATSTGVFNGFTRRLEVQVASSSAKTSFLFAVQSGEGGFELGRNTTIEGTDGRPGNVYSNGDVLGENSSGGKSGSKILGDVWAVGKISGLESDDAGGVYIAGNAHAGELIRCQVLGDVKAPVPPVVCPHGGEYQVEEAPEEVPLAVMDVEFWKQQAVQSSIWTGDCIIGSGDASDCAGSEEKLGSVKIEGNLTIRSGTEVTLTGPIWVEGDVTVNSNVDVLVDESLGSEGVVIVVDYPSDRFGRGKVVTESNVSFSQTSAGGPPIFVSTNTEDNCAVDPAIKVSSNTATVVFSAPEGCVFFQSNSFVRGVLAKKTHLSGNSSIVYDPRLAYVILETGLGGWAVTGYREIE